MSLPFSSMSKSGRWRLVVSPSIVTLGNFAELIRSITCMVLKAKANDRRTSSPCHDEFRGPSSDYIRQDLEPFFGPWKCRPKPGHGRRQATIPNEDRYLVLTARRQRNMNATLVQQQLHSATGTTVSTQTVRNRLHGLGLYASRPMFRISVHPDNSRIFIWRDRGSRNNPAFVHKSVRFCSEGVLVYGGISIDGRTDLYIIRDGPLTARQYRDEILRPIVVPYAAAIGDDIILMDDNCRPHRVNLVEDFFFEEGIV
ncbi:transposable element Tcb2 transposase [Trichonephila clavipes]|nr:transposable element Tcb2 transposase [Trichonephila clavipes]